METRRGVFLNLQETPYYFTVKDFTFYFSSKLYLLKFAENVENYVKNENIKLNVKYKVDTDYTTILLINFYKKIEKRGFRVYDNVEQENISVNNLFKVCRKWR